MLGSMRVLIFIVCLASGGSSDRNTLALFDNFENGFNETVTFVRNFVIMIDRLVCALR